MSSPKHPSLDSIPPLNSVSGSNSHRRLETEELPQQPGTATMVEMTETRRRRRRTTPTTLDPFAGRDNYPSLEEAFAPVEQYDAESSVFLGGGASHVSSSSSNMMLNLSIDARAALDEHLRHVARFGIDGMEAGSSHRGGDEEENDQLPRSETTSPSLDNVVHTPLDPLDDQWERLLNSSSISTPNNSFFVPNSLLSNEHNNNIFVHHSPPLHEDHHDEDDEAIEVLTDLSTDYFNSSRVHLLRTPEKNRVFAGQVTTRPTNHNNSSSSSNEESLLSTHRSDNDASHLSFTEQFPLDTSFATSLSHVDTTSSSSSRIGALDVSHISTADGSGDTPSTSVALPLHHHTPATDHLTTIDDGLLPDVSSSSSPARIPLGYSSPPRGIRTATFLPTSPSSTSRRSEWPTPTRSISKHRLLLRRPHMPPRATSAGTIGSNHSNRSDDSRSIAGKENQASNHDRDDSFNALGLSPISTRSVATNSHFSTSHLDKDLPAQPRIADTLSLPPQRCQVDDASDDNAQDHNRLTDEVAYDATHDSDVSTLQNQSSSVKDSSSASRSGGGGGVSTELPPSSPTRRIHSFSSYEERRKYRTVVPLRVFSSTLPPNDLIQTTDLDDFFPEPYDSFSCPYPYYRHHRQHHPDQQGATSTSAVKSISSRKSDPT